MRTRIKQFERTSRDATRALRLFRAANRTSPGRRSQHHAPTLPRSHAPTSSRGAFTIIEIAISIAVIGFALVAIIGVLPTAMRVQQDNRADTLIDQDGV